MSNTDFTKSVFRGIGQVMLQNNALTGLTFTVGLFCASWLAGVGALVGSIIGTKVAELSGYDENEIKDGLYGFNGALVGVALLFYFKINLVLLSVLVVAAAISTLIMHTMRRHGYAPYTFPFVITTWISFLCIKTLNVVSPVFHSAVSFLNTTIFSGVSLGFSQVMLQASIITGVLFFIGILLNSGLSALYAVLGSLAGLFFGQMFFPTLFADLSLGIFGFNGVLCGLAFTDKKWHSIFFALLAVVLSVVIMRGFLALNIIALTAPFVLATWATFALREV